MEATKPINPEVLSESEAADLKKAAEDDQPKQQLVRHPGVEVSLSELAAMQGAGLEVIKARATILETLRKAAIRATSPEDWLLFKDKKGLIIGYLQDCGCDRVRDLYGIEIMNVQRPEKVPGPDGDSFTYLIQGDGYCGITHQTVESIEGGRSSTDDFLLGKQGVELELACRKAARANLDGNITRELAGLKSVPIQELEEAWKDTNKRSGNCRLGRGFGSGGERQGADVTVAEGVKQSDAPKCPKCGDMMKFVKAKEGKYEAFWSCVRYQSGDCDGTVKFVAAGKPDKTAPETASHTKPDPRSDAPATPEQEPPGLYPKEDGKEVNRGDINF